MGGWKETGLASLNTEAWPPVVAAAASGECSRHRAGQGASEVLAVVVVEVMVVVVLAVILVCTISATSHAHCSGCPTCCSLTP